MYQDKTILVVGYGVEGKTLVQYLKNAGAQITVADQNPEVEDPTIGVDWKTGADYLNDLENFDLIAFSPGVKLATYQQLLASNKPLITQTQIFFEQSPTKNIIGVTGTNGKGTTCTMLYQMMQNAGLNVYLAGNIGEPMLPLLSKLTDEDWVILELSSYQLRDISTSPKIGVMLNITPDHLDQHGEFEDYVAAKANLIRFQTEQDWAVINQDYSVTADLASLTRAQIKWFGGEDFTDTGWQLSIPGVHNHENAAAAMAVGEILEIDPVIIEKSLSEFTGLPHRLELVAEINGIKFIDDSISTSPAPAMAAIEAFSQPKICILGGSPKSANYAEIAQKIAQSTSIKAIFTIGTTGPKISQALLDSGFHGEIISSCENISQVVEQAFKRAESGDIVLLSPGDASFDWFKNYKDRGEQFSQAVRKLAEYN